MLKSLRAGGGIQTLPLRQGITGSGDLCAGAFGGPAPNYSAVHSLPMKESTAAEK